MIDGPQCDCHGALPYSLMPAGLMFPDLLVLKPHAPLAQTGACVWCLPQKCQKQTRAVLKQFIKLALMLPEHSRFVPSGLRKLRQILQQNWRWGSFSEGVPWGSYGGQASVGLQARGCAHRSRGCGGGGCLHSGLPVNVLSRATRHFTYSLPASSCSPLLLQGKQKAARRNIPIFPTQKWKLAFSILLLPHLTFQ